MPVKVQLLTLPALSLPALLVLVLRNKKHPSEIILEWFVVRGNESMLEQLEKEWGAVALQMAWRLEPIYV